MRRLRAVNTAFSACATKLFVSPGGRALVDQLLIVLLGFYVAYQSTSLGLAWGVFLVTLVYTMLVFGRIMVLILCGIGFLFLRSEDVEGRTYLNQMFENFLKETS